MEYRPVDDVLEAGVTEHRENQARETVEMPGVVSDESQNQLYSHLSQGLTKHGIFFLLLFSKIGYQHRLGVMVIVGFLLLYYFGNSEILKGVNNRTNSSTSRTSLRLCLLVIAISLNLVFFFYVFRDDHIYRTLYFMPASLNYKDTLSFLWMVFVTDGCAVCLTLCAKSLLASLPMYVLSGRKKGKYFMLTEHIMSTFRFFLPIPAWIRYLGGFSFLSLFYLIAKTYNLSCLVKRLKIALASFRSHSNGLGVPVTSGGLAKLDSTCPICHDVFTEPIALSPCSHVFCTDCCTYWFDRRNTCPLCRVVIVQDVEFKNGNTPMTLHFY